MKTYSFGMLQTNAFKALKGYTATLLVKYDISTYDWALLGILFDEPKGYGTTSLAQKLHVSKPYVTKSITSLIDKGWIEKTSDNESDLRTVCFVLTNKARITVPEIEAYLKAEMKPILSGVPKLQLLAYVMVLKHITKKLEKSIDSSAYEVSSKDIQ